MQLRVSVANKYSFQPKDVDTSQQFGSTFGKCEVEEAARYLVKFLTECGHAWNKFSMIDLARYYDRNSIKDQPLFGLLGPWLDDGGWEFLSGDFVVNMGDSLAVTDEFLNRISKFKRA